MSVVQGLLRMSKDYFKEPVKVVRLWVHECERVLADRMINDTDMTKFNEFRVTVTKKYFDDVNQVSACSNWRLLLKLGWAHLGRTCMNLSTSTVLLQLHSIVLSA